MNYLKVKIKLLVINSFLFFMFKYKNLMLIYHSQNYSHNQVLINFQNKKHKDNKKIIIKKNNINITIKTNKKIKIYQMINKKILFK